MNRQIEVGQEWERSFERWLEPFLVVLGDKRRRRWAPLYVRGLIGPGDRKSVQPMASRVAEGDHEQLHHFVATSTWACEPLQDVLLERANELVGGKDAHLIVDDTALVKKGDHSVGVAQQYCGQLGKNANCQSMVSLTLSRNEVPVLIGLRLYLPESWAKDSKRRKRCGVPAEVVFKPKWQIALDEIERVVEGGTCFGDVLADAGYGVCSEFRQRLNEMGLKYVVGVSSDHLVYPLAARVRKPEREQAMGRPPSRGSVSKQPCKAREAIAALGLKAFQRLSWRSGSKGRLEAEFAAIRVRAADGPRVHGHRHGPGDEQWLLCERRRNGETKYYLSNYSADVSLQQLASAAKARWSCEQAHQQAKEELGLDHFEGRKWHGLHHHALLTMIAYAFLQHIRLSQKRVAA
jgi:SRSO17 transposase